MGTMLKDEVIIGFIESLDYKYVKRFKNKRNNTMVTVICPKGHERDIQYNNFKTKNGSCKACADENLSIGKRNSTEEVIKVFNDFGFEILDGLSTYRNNKSKLIVKCSEGHTKETTLGNFKEAKNKCQECVGRVKLTIEFIKSEFEKRNYQLLEDEYIGSTTNMRYICNRHPEKIRTIRWSNFRNNKGCRDCSTERNSEKQRIPYNIVHESFKERNYTLLTDTYINKSQRLEYICNEHEEYGVQYLSYCNFHKTNHNCKMCIKQNYRGEHKYNWNGGIGTLSDFLRKKIDVWKEDSMRDCGYRCVITGKYFDVIHHLHSFNKIVSETLDTLSLDVHNEIEKYTSQELFIIEETCLKLHYKYGLGVCLTNMAHDLFHKEYGKYDNNKEQFEEFKQRCLNGEFDNLLKGVI
ncbi:hypothetical protein [Priestia megaterium]|uniref:hypothetical protein n=1 Tax=Priestia megaterium TaxID=1404 RepID=UPI00287808E8|nr:hypothetical protein [Priestia megaterium]